MGASKSSGRDETMPERAPSPLAEYPTKTRCVKVLSANAPPRQLPCGCSPGAHKHDPGSMLPELVTPVVYYIAVVPTAPRALLDVQCGGRKRRAVGSSTSGRGWTEHRREEAYGRGTSRSDRGLSLWRVEELADHRGQPIGAVDEPDVGGAGKDSEAGARQAGQVAEDTAATQAE